MPRRFSVNAGLVAAITLGGVGCSGCTKGASDSQASDRGYYLPYVASEIGLTLVDAADFDKSIVAISGDTTQARLFASVPPLGTEPRVGSPHAVLVLVGSQWHRVWLEKGRSQMPTAVGSPVAAAVCSTQTIYLNLGEPDSGVLRFTDAGQNQTCFDSDDHAGAVALSESVDTVPLTFSGRLVDQIHGATGALEGFVLVQDNALVLLRYPSGSTSTLIASLPAVSVASVQRVPGAVWLTIGTEWRRVSVADGLSPARYAPESGYVQSSGPSTDSEFFYFLDAAADGGIPTRLWRLRLDGAADAEMLYETSEQITYVSNTTGRIWLSQGNASPKTLWWIDKQDVAAGLHVGEQIGAGGISYIARQDRFTVSLQDVSQNQFTVKMINDAGAELLNVANAQFELQRLDFPALFGLGGTIPQSYFGLAMGPSISQTRNGAEVFGYDLRTGAGHYMFTYGEPVTVNQSGFGPAGLGRYYVMSAGGESGPDLVAFDLENHRFKLFPKTPGVTEVPLGF